VRDFVPSDDRDALRSGERTGDDYSTTPALLGQFLDWLAPRAANGTVTETVSQVLGD
jgi:hypothetical protein